MDYECSTDNAHDEEYPINRESNFPLSPNSKDYEGSTNEGKHEDDEEYPPSQHFKSTNDGSENFLQLRMV